MDCTMEHSTIKNEILHRQPRGWTCGIVLNEVSHRKRNEIPYDHTHTWNLKNKERLKYSNKLVVASRGKGRWVKQVKGIKRYKPQL